MKVLSQQSQLSGTQSTIDNATVVRLYNETAESKECHLHDSNGVGIGTMTIGATKVEYIQKKPDEYLTGSIGIKCSKIAYSPMMAYASWSGGGAPSYHTVTDVDRWYYLTDSSDVDGVFSRTLSNVPTVPVSGKRFYFISLTYRLVGGQPESYNNAENWFKPSNQGGVATVTLNGHTPTYHSVSKSKYNQTCFYYGQNDLNSSGSPANVTFAFSNTSTDTTNGNSNPQGGYQYVIWVFDYVESVAVSSASVFNSDTEGSPTTQGPFNVAAAGAGTGWTAAAKFVNGVSSNPNDNVNPSWTKGTGETDTTYTTVQEGDNGTNEVAETSYSFFQTNAPTNITGTMGFDPNPGNDFDGLGAMAAIVRFKPAQQ
tara:strand:+ start:2529 stop:3638 length:1110 start_codon:yes stop_codon:yes gene_type:complete